MFFIQAEHNPPHFHALYGEYIGSFNIETGEMFEGDLPAKAQELIMDWLDAYRDEMMDIWRTQQFRKLPPLV
jgi:hypothetical protein